MELEKLLRDFIKYAESNNLTIEGIAVADDKRIILEHHFTPDLERNIYSQTKSYMSTAAGIAISQGKLSLDDKLADFFPEYVPEHPDPRLLRISLKHLLTMSSGFGKPYLMMGDRRKGIGFPDYLAYMMQQPMEKEPGESFMYSTADSIFAGRMIEKAVGQRLGEYMYHHLFSKLEQGWPVWENDPMGHPIGGGGMFMRLADMIKLGQLYLGGGIWKGERIVENDWIKEATSKQIDTPNPDVDIWLCGYGYQFWLSPYPGSYRAAGAFGQITTVLPGIGLVVSVQCPEHGDFEKVKMALHEQLFMNLY